MNPGESPYDGPPITTQMGEALVVRLSRLERQNHMLRRLTVVLGLGLLTAFLLSLFALRATGALSGENGVSVRRITLRDAAGMTRGSWHVSEDGAATLELNDLNGVMRMKLTVLQDGSPGLVYQDKNAQTRVVLGLLAGEGGSLAFADEQGNTRAVLGLAPDAAGNLVFSDQYGSPRAGFGVSAAGTPHFTLADDASRPPPDTTSASSQR
jgi:hypothetical protein